MKELVMEIFTSKVARCNFTERELCYKLYINMIAISLEEQDEYKKNWLHRIEFFDQQAYLKASVVIGEVLIEDILLQKVCGKKVDTSSRSVLSGLICFANSKGIFFFFYY